MAVSYTPDLEEPRRVECVGVYLSGEGTDGSKVVLEKFEVDQRGGERLKRDLRPRPSGLLRKPGGRSHRFSCTYHIPGIW